MTCTCGASVIPGQTGIELEDGGIQCDDCIAEQFDSADDIRYECADAAFDMREGA